MVAVYDVATDKDLLALALVLYLRQPSEKVQCVYLHVVLLCASNDKFISLGMEAETPAQSEAVSRPLTDHCDYLMDSIDAQLNQLQVSILTNHGQPVTNSLTESSSFRNTTRLSRRTGPLNSSLSNTRDTGLGSVSGISALSGTDVLFPMKQEANNVSECEDQKEVFLSFTGAPEVTALFDRSPGFGTRQPIIPVTDHGRLEAETDGESRKEQYEWRVQQLLGPQQIEIQGYRSDTNTIDSIRTEDFALCFNEGMVDPTLNFDTEPDGEGSFMSSNSFSVQPQESAGLYLEPNSQQGNLGSEVSGHPLEWNLFRRKECSRDCAQLDHMSRQDRCGALSKTSARIHPAQSLTSAEKDEFDECASSHGNEDDTVADGPVNSTAPRLNVVQQFREELEHVLQRTRSQAGPPWAEQAASRALTLRTESIESLGGRISKLSQINMSEKSSQQRNFPSRNRIQVVNPSRESPVSPNPLKGNGLMTSSSPGVIIQEDLETNFGDIGMKMKGALKSQPESPERRGRDNNPGAQSLSIGDPANLIPIQRESSALSHKLLLSNSEDNQQGVAMVNGTTSACYTAPALVPHCTPRVSAGNTNYSAKTNTSRQWNRTASAHIDFQSQPLAVESCRRNPVCPSGSVSPPGCSFWKGSSGSELAPDHRSNIARSALHPKRRMQLPDLSQGKLTGFINITTAKRTHARSNTDGGYREELGSHGLGRNRAKLLSHQTGELDASMSGRHAGKKCCNPRREPGRDKKKMVDEEDFEHFFRESGSKWTTSRPPKSDPSLKEWAGHIWNWNGAPKMISSTRCPLALRSSRRCQQFDAIRTDEAQLEQSTVKLQQHVKHDVHSLKEITEESQQDTMALESRQREAQNEAYKASTELVVPEFKRDGYLQELRDFEVELDLLEHRSAIAALNKERDDLRAHLRQLQSSLTILEHQDLDQGLRSMKEELFTEQQSTRIRIEQLQQHLEEAEVRLEQKTAKITQLLEKNNNLESQVRELERTLRVEGADSNTNNSIRVHELLSQLTERDLKVSALEKILSEKELEQLRLRESMVVLRAEKEAQLSSMETQRKEHEQQLTSNTAERKWEQDEEALTLQEQVWAQEESMQSEELKQEAKELVQNALVQDDRKWEAGWKEQLQQQCLSLEEENGKALKQANEDLEKERRNSLALQHKLVELQKRIQELLFQNHSLQREMDQTMNNLRTEMTEEKQKEMQQLREEMQLEKKHDIERLTSKMVQMEEELQDEKNETSLKEREARMQVERAERSFVSEIKMECERIQVLIQSTQVRALGRTISLPNSDLGSLTRMTLGQAIRTLRRAGEDLRQLVIDLHQELESQRCVANHLQRDKDHIEEVSKLQRLQLKDSGGRVENTLQQQLQKGNELRSVQRNMDKWKDETTYKPEEKLNETSLYKHQSEHQRKTEMLENDIHQLPLEHGETSHLQPTSTPSMASSAVASFRQKTFGTLKLLQHLQIRVKQLRTENIIYHGASLKDGSILHTLTSSSHREMSRVTPDRSSSSFSGKESRK
ncbi:uncharacterized protein si:ch211-102c2.8 [Scyliorhinus canicula]|uniref:uncharacterized protein si:ch211-102c2.8 n=1 Tax=Scyliorhinus canicula TaxID=7830 RepID=UPI0018F58050|nr:uncharacterized protein si:ch211-102c2.8 [Scyliorhinus canicula]